MIGSPPFRHLETMKPSNFAFPGIQLLLISLLLVTGLSCGSSSDSGDDDDDDGVTAAQCDTTCEHVYEDCGLALVDASGDTLTQSECETSCLDQEETLVDCLEDVTCTEAAVNPCLEETDEEEEDTDEDECANLASRV